MDITLKNISQDLAYLQAPRHLDCQVHVDDKPDNSIIPPRVQMKKFQIYIISVLHKVNSISVGGNNYVTF